MTRNVLFRNTILHLKHPAREIERIAAPPHMMYFVKIDQPNRRSSWLPVASWFLLRVSETHSEHGSAGGIDSMRNMRMFPPSRPRIMLATTNALKATNTHSRASFNLSAPAAFFFLPPGVRRLTVPPILENGNVVGVDDHSQAEWALTRFPRPSSINPHGPERDLTIKINRAFFCQDRLL